MLKRLKEENKIDDTLYEKIYPQGSQPARLYGLAKVHKNAVPTRPVLSMPGSAYHGIALQLTEWLSVVPECRINTSSKDIADSLNDIMLEEDEEVISFDVVSLYTNVPVKEAISECADLLYSGQHTLPPVDKSTFIELMQLCTCNVQMLTHDGYYRQIDGLAMGSPPAPLVANGWLSKRDPVIMENAKLKARFMDDIIRSIKTSQIDHKMQEINSLHPSLKFTIERETNGELPFLDMLIQHCRGKLTSTWYTKPTDTGLIMNYHSLAPKKYKRSVVSGLVHRIYRSCSTWENIHTSLAKAKFILEKNQYPPQFYEPIIERTLEKILEKKLGTASGGNVPSEVPPEEKVPKVKIFLRYRGIATEHYCRALRRCQAPCDPVLTLRKLRTVLPSLKAKVERKIRSFVVYKISCPRCQACYVGYTTQHLTQRFSQHCKPSQPVGKHLRNCNAKKEISASDIEILAQSSSVFRLMTLEALWQRELRPTINTKDEFRSRELTIKL